MTGWCRSPAETRRGSPTGSVASAAAGTPSRHLSDADKLRKVLLELVDTERAYVKVRLQLPTLQYCYENDTNQVKYQYLIL